MMSRALVFSPLERNSFGGALLRFPPPGAMAVFSSAIVVSGLLASSGRWAVTSRSNLFVGAGGWNGWVIAIAGPNRSADGFPFVF